MVWESRSAGMGLLEEERQGRFVEEGNGDLGYVKLRGPGVNVGR